MNAIELIVAVLISWSLGFIQGVITNMWWFYRDRRRVYRDRFRADHERSVADVNKDIQALYRLDHDDG